MSANVIVARGVVKSDGSLELEGHPKLPVGPVEVVVRALPTAAAPKEDWWEFMQRARRELEESGHKFMNDEEMAAHIAWLREEDRIDEMLKQPDATKKE